MGSRMVPTEGNGGITDVEFCDLASAEVSGRKLPRRVRDFFYHLRRGRRSAPSRIIVRVVCHEALTSFAICHLFNSYGVYGCEGKVDPQFEWRFMAARRNDPDVVRIIDAHSTGVGGTRSEADVEPGLKVLYFIGALIDLGR